MLRRSPQMLVKLVSIMKIDHFASAARLLTHVASGDGFLLESLWGMLARTCTLIGHSFLGKPLHIRSFAPTVFVWHMPGTSWLMYLGNRRWHTSPFEWVAPGSPPGGLGRILEASRSLPEASRSLPKAPGSQNDWCQSGGCFPHTCPGLPTLAR